MNDNRIYDVAFAFFLGIAVSSLVWLMVLQRQCGEVMGGCR